MRPATVLQVMVATEPVTEMDLITGAEAGIAFTITEKEFVAVRCCALIANGLESVTTVVNRFVLGAWLPRGVQLIMPFASTAAFVGPLVSAYASGLAGISGSVAVFVTIKVVNA